MNNILTAPPPVTVVIDGVEHQINTDFRAALRVILAFEDETLTKQERQIVMLGNLYPTPPRDLRGALEQAILFLNGGKANGSERGPRVYSFSKDAEFIYAAFRSTHGIDLNTAVLHWWQFLALFMDLGQDTTFCQLVSLRKRVKTSKASKEERRAAADIGEMFDIPDTDDLTLEEREMEARFNEIVEQGRNKNAGA